MNNPTTTEPKKTESEERKDALAKREPAHIAISQMTGAGEELAVLGRSHRLEPRDFKEMLICAEIAFKMKLGKCESVADATARIMRGAILGLDAMTSVDQLFLIGERLCTFARTLHALVEQRPDCIECTVLENECMATLAKVRAHKRGGSPTIFTFTIEEAKQLVGPEKFKGTDANWAKDPKGMLIAKCLKRAIDRTWPGAFLGLSTVEDERDRTALEVNPSTGEVTSAGLPIQQRDFAAELEGIRGDIAACATEADFKRQREAISTWAASAPDAFKKQAQDVWNDARNAFKKKAEPPANG